MDTSGTLELLQEMAKLQDSHNQKVHPQWRTQNFAYRRAVWLEAAELIEHAGWKWWRKQSSDLAQLILEVVDIWHFGLSMLLLEDKVNADLASAINEGYKRARPDDLLSTIENFVRTTLGQESFCIEGFLDICLALDLTFEVLYKQYIGKNVLNQFRQDHGYMTGEYHKNWGGLEDNEHLAELITQTDSSGSQYQSWLYAALEDRYSNV